MRDRQPYTPPTARSADLLATVAVLTEENARLRKAAIVELAEPLKFSSHGQFDDDDDLDALRKQLAAVTRERDAAIAMGKSLAASEMEKRERAVAERDEARAALAEVYTVYAYERAALVCDEYRAAWTANRDCMSTPANADFLATAARELARRIRAEQAATLKMANVLRGIAERHAERLQVEQRAARADALAECRRKKAGK
jgi:hypothetical protein